MKSFLFPVLIFAMTFAGPLSPAEVGRSKNAAPETIQVNVIPLLPGIPQTGSIPPADEFRVCRIGDTQYAIEFPGGPMKLKIELGSSRDASLYVRRSQPVVSQNGVIIADFKAETPGVAGLGETLELPLFGSSPLEEGNYFIAIGNCSAAGETIFNLAATFLAPSTEDTVALTPERPEVGSIPAPTSGCLLGQTQYTFPAFAPVSCGTIPFYNVELRGDQNVDLYARLNQRVAVEDGRIIADFASQSESGRENLILGPVAQNSVIYVAAANCSAEEANFTVAFIPLHGDPVPPPIVTACELVRSPSGTVSLIITGLRIRREARIEIGGVIPKKLKFKQPDHTGNFFGKVIAKGGVCRGLPGAIIIRDPGTSCFVPFQCNNACSNP